MQISTCKRKHKKNNAFLQLWKKDVKKSWGLTFPFERFLHVFCRNEEKCTKMYEKQMEIKITIMTISSLKPRAVKSAE